MWFVVSQVPVAFNVLVGVAAPLLWTAQNTYVGRSAAAAAKLLQEPTEKWTTRNLVNWWIFFVFGGIFGGQFSFLVLFLSFLVGFSMVSSRFFRARPEYGIRWGWGFYGLEMILYHHS